MAARRNLHLDDSECVAKFGRAKLTGLAVWTSAWTRRAVDGLRFAPVPYTVQAQVFALPGSTMFLTMFLHLVLVLTITTPSNAKINLLSNAGKLR